MIVAAGLGTRLRPLSELLPKPAMPVRGLPLVAYQLALLARHGVTEVVINAHHLPERLMQAAREHCPPGVALHFSLEPELLDTGGAIRQVADFLRGSDPCLILGGDMLLDLDLAAFAARHRARGDAVTLLLLRDPRADSFGSLGVDAEGRVRRIARRFDLGGEVDSGLYTWVNAVSPRAFDSLPERSAFSHLDHWIAPLLADGARDVRGEVLAREDCVWEPVGTPAEYLAANLRPPRLRYLDADAGARARGVRFCAGEVILGVGATLGDGASLARVVVWDGESVPAGLRASDGVFAGGRFHPCGLLPDATRAAGGGGRAP
jgi:mannose-1-phosphate guanylyltransferase